MELQHGQIMLRILTVVLLSAVGVRCCNKPQVKACESFVTECNSDGYDACLDSAGFNDCTDVILQTTVQGHKALFDIDPTCEYPCARSLFTCSFKILESTAILAGFTSGSSMQTPSALTGLSCLCQDSDAWLNNLIDEFTTCVADSDLNQCPKELRNAVSSDTLSTQLRNALGDTTQICDSLRQANVSLVGDCDCSKGADDCTRRHLGQVVGLEAVLAEDDFQPNVYPKCLTIMNRTYTKQDYKRAGDCLHNLPEKCGLRDFNPGLFGLQASNGGQQVEIRSGYALLTLRYSCAEGCTYPERTTNMAMECFDGFANKSSAEIKMLDATAKKEYCDSFQPVFACVVKNFGTCPLLLQTFVAISERLNNLQNLLGGDVPADLVEVLQQIRECDFNVVEFVRENTDLYPTDGSATLGHQMSLLGFLVAAAAAYIHMM